MRQNGKIFVVSGPSGAGKTSLVSALITSIGSQLNLQRVITYTSRLKRSNEVDAQDYCFVSEEEFKSKIESGFFIEWSQAYGAYYGSPCHDLEKLASGISLIMILDLPGAMHLIQNFNAISIWIVPPDMQTLKERLLLRGSDDNHKHDFRLKLAHQELSDYEKLSCFDHKIVNRDVQQALDAFQIIIRHECPVAMLQSEASI
jgi:guanylate kinase